MSEHPENPPFIPPVSTFGGPIAELIAQRMLQPPARPGLLAILDRFEIRRLLGSGGMGVVLLARDSVSGQEVAVKLVKTDLVTNQHVVHRFLKEAGHLKRLNHTGIVPVLEISDRPEGPYFVMPFFEKGSLAGRIKPGEPLPAETILQITLPIAEGLGFAHRRGIIHRDLKPANILLTADGQACLADFGLARTLFNDTIVDVESRQLEGTAPYMSPAVAAGDAEDTRCDIYSFGALLYEMLTGLPPYQGRGTKEILDQILARPPKSITNLNPAADRHLVAVAEGCMARQLRDRYADMRDVLGDLQRISENRRPLGRSAGRRSHVRQIVWLGAALAAAAIVTGGIYWQQHLPAPANNVVPRIAVAPPPPVAPWTLAHAPRQVTTFAGQAGVSGSADGPGDQAQFRLPQSLALDKSGNLYVADTGNDTIRKITPDGTVTTLAGLAGHTGSADGPGSDARFFAPFGVAVDRKGNVYVADTGNNTIRKIDTNDVVTTLAGQAGNPGYADGPGDTAQFRNPWGLAADWFGNVYVADLSNKVIRKITTNGVVSTYAGPGWTNYDGSLGRFEAPYDVAITSLNRLLISDNGNHVVDRIPLDGVFSVAPLARRAAADAAGTFLLDPQGLAVDSQWNVYVANGRDHTITRISDTGEISTFAGQSGISGSNDGESADARFNSPAGIAVDADYNVYVADTQNHCIRKITLKR